MDKFVAAQQHAEEKYLELEGKRMKMIKEVDDQKIRVEENRREADWQHEMQLWMMLTQALGGGMSFSGPQRYPYAYPPSSSGSSSAPHSPETSTFPPKY